MLGPRSGEDVDNLSEQVCSVSASWMSPLPSQTCLKCCGSHWHVGARGITASTIRAIQRPRLCNRVQKPQMVLESEPVDIHTANPSTQSKHKNGDKSAPTVALAAHGTPVQAPREFTPYSLCWRGPPAGPSVVPPPLSISYPTTLYQTEPNQTQANIM